MVRPENGPHRERKAELVSDLSTFRFLILSYQSNNRHYPAAQIELSAPTFPIREYYYDPNRIPFFQLLKSYMQRKEPYPIIGEIVLLECQSVGEIPTSADLIRHADKKITVDRIPQIRIATDRAGLVETEIGLYETVTHTFLPAFAVIDEMVAACNGIIIDTKQDEEKNRLQYVIGFGNLGNIEDTMRRIGNAWSVADNGFWIIPDRSQH